MGVHCGACVEVVHPVEREVVFPEAVLRCVNFALTALLLACDEVGVAERAVILL